MSASGSASVQYARPNSPPSSGSGALSTAASLQAGQAALPPRPSAAKRRPARSQSGPARPSAAQSITPSSRRRGYPGTGPRAWRAYDEPVNAADSDPLGAGPFGVGVRTTD